MAPWPWYALGTALRRRLDFEDATAVGPPAARRRLDGADAAAFKGASSSAAGVLARPGASTADAGGSCGAWKAALLTVLPIAAARVDG